MQNVYGTVRRFYAIVQFVYAIVLFSTYPNKKLHPGGKRTINNRFRGIVKVGSGHPPIGLGVYSLGVYSLGVYSLGPPILDLGTHSLEWESTLWESTLWESTYFG